jgi:serine/alanine adding enzyme
LKVTTIDPITDKRWDDFVIGHPEATIYHHSAWSRVLAERYGHSPFCYVLEDDNKEILAGIPLQRIDSHLTGKRIVCLPCSEYCYPLSTVEGGAAQLLAVVKDKLDEGQQSYLEIRGWQDQSSPQELGLEEYPYYLTHVSNLTEGPDVWMKKIKNMTRHNLKRAGESLVIHEAQDEKDLKQFHRLSVLTRSKLNLLPWPYDFSKAIYQHIIVPGHGFLLLTELRNEIIGSAMCFQFGDTVVYRYNAWDSHYSYYCANYLLTWQAMIRAYNEGYRWFHFGVSNPENEGLVRFKRLWWSEEDTLAYYYYPKRGGVNAIPQTNFLYRFHTALNSITPQIALKLMGQAVYRHMG